MFDAELTMLQMDDVSWKLHEEETNEKQVYKSQNTFN